MKFLLHRPSARELKKLKEAKKLDLGSGGIKKEGFTTVDIAPPLKDQVDVFMPMQEAVKYVGDNQIEEVRCMGAIGFLDGEEIYKFMNELHRLIKPKGKLIISVAAIHLPTGVLNPRAWTVLLEKTHFSTDSFKCFMGGSTLHRWGVKPWKIVSKNHYESGGLDVIMSPIKDEI